MDKKFWFLKNLPLGFDLDRRAVCHRPPYFIDLCIGHRDAAFGPVSKCFAVPVEVIRQPMDEQLATRRYTQFFRACQIVSVWVRDVNRPMILAVRVMPVKDISALWRLVIALPDLRPNRIFSERDEVGL